MKSRSLVVTLSLVFLSGFVLRGQSDHLALTPPMGWNSWNAVECHVSDALIRAQADMIASNGMREAGYLYVNIDDCWEGKRDASGVIHPNSNFPDMKKLADYIHGKGLKVGIYSSPGPQTCAGFEGSYKHEEQDAQTYAGWGIDNLKYDWCSAEKVYKTSENEAAYKRMAQALAATRRPILYSLCQYGLEHPWTWAPSIGANSWRTTDDIRPTFESIIALGFGEQDGLGRFAGPGHWNDPDMLEVGNGELSLDEDRLHFGLWSMLAAPLLAGNDLTKMKPEVLEILTNREVIAVDQDALGIQGHRIWQEGPIEVWIKPLADHSTAVALFNKGESASNVSVQLRELGLSERVQVRDLWKARELGYAQERFSANVPRRGVVLVKMQ